MFPTFTGSSRRPRNVNLSGQKNINPFAANSWSPSAVAAGASKTVADAQAERRHRQQERERTKAAQDIQRTWRAHRVRRRLRTARREALADLYRPGSTCDPAERVLVAFPLVLAVANGTRDGDLECLAHLAEDLEQTSYSALVSGRVPPPRLGCLVRVLVTALERNGPASTPPILMRLLVELVSARPHAALDNLRSYFRMLSKYARFAGPVPAEALDLLRRAILAPLISHDGGTDDVFSLRAYEAFTMSFLTQPLDLVEKDIASFSESISLDALSASVLRVFESQVATVKSRDELLWLLAHFIGLLRSQQRAVRTTLHLRALFALLSYLSGDIRLRLQSREAKASGSAGASSSDGLPPYIVSEIRSLVDRGEISELLDKFTAGHTGASAQEDASLLAGYTLTLIRCFPDHGDDIRMRLYLADFPSTSGILPSVKYFWDAMAATRVFASISSSPKKALDFLLQRNYFKASPAAVDNSSWDREWRTVLLFLELYTFVLRLTDDEDFFAGLGSADTTAVMKTGPASRVRLSALSLDTIKRLSLFLENLAFTLHYNSAELLQDSISRDSSTLTLSGLAAMGSKKDGAERGRANSQQPDSYSVISGLDFGAFKNMVTTAIRMLYERDSRRRFLPAGHWLMTSNFDMEGFLSAVVLEEQRQHDLRESGRDEDEEDEEDEEIAEEEYQQPVFTWAGQRRSRYAIIEQFKAEQRRFQRSRTLAAIGPKLEILHNMPYVIPFETRVQIFKQFVHLDKQRRRDGFIDPDQWRMHVLNQHGGAWAPNDVGRGVISRHHAKIRRGKLFEDAFDQFYDLGEGLKEPMQITFVDQFGNVEAGIDGGGVTKEFLTSVTREAFADDLSLFVENSHNELYPNPLALDQRQETLRATGIMDEDPDWGENLMDLLDQFEFMGRIVGKCLYEGILLDIVFAGFFLLKWSSTAKDASSRASINDLREMDEELYQGMMQLKNYQGDVSELGIDFTINDQVSLPGQPVRTKTRNLIPGGDKITVTNENRPLYISYVARHRLVVQPFQQTRAFLRGLGSIIDPSWLSMFNQSELQRLVGGDSSEIDVEDLRKNTIYSGVYQIGTDGKEHPTVKLFWEVMRSLRDDQRRDVLRYVTSTPRAPLLGFSQLSPRFSIRDGGTDQERLPSASTCVNLLKLPQYRDAATLRSKLLYAVSAGAGFDLS